MMYLLFNEYGAIKDKQINEWIVQGSNNVNKIGVAIDGVDPTSFVLVGVCKLPNGEVITTEPVDEQAEIIDGVYGVVFSLSKKITALEGTLRINIQAINTTTDKIITSYTVFLCVNEGVDPGEIVMMTADQYQNLLSKIELDVQNTDLANSVRKIEYNASGKTMGELATVIDGSSVVGLSLSGLGNYNGIYFGSIYQASSNVYFEIERFSHDGSYSKNRWVGSCAASTLVSDVLTSSSSFYQPYALAKDLNIKWDNYVSGTSTLADLYNFITNNTFKQVVTAIVRFAEGGVYSVSFVKTSAEATTYGFEMEEYASVTKNNAASRYVGTNVSGDTILSAIMEKTSPYYFPYLTKNNGIESVYVTVGNKTIKDIYDEVYHDNDGQLKFLELWDSTQGGLTGRYLGWMIKTSNNYYFDFDYISPQLDNTNARFMGGPLTGSEGFGDVFSTSGEFYHPIASNPMTATGDLIIGGSSGLPARLAKGSAGQILAMNSQGTTPEWTTAPSGLHLYRHHVAIMATNAGNVSFIYVDIYSGSNSSIDNLAKLHAATDGKNITCSGYFRSNTVYYPNVISISTTSSTVSIVYFATNSTETGTLIDSNTTSLIGDTVQTIY